jgi:hypothetical protein
MAQRSLITQTPIFKNTLAVLPRYAPNGHHTIQTSSFNFDLLIISSQICALCFDYIKMHETILNDTSPSNFTKMALAKH